MNYFAYGSNMNWEQMQRRCPSSRFVCVGRLSGYRFAIARHSRLRKCGTANIIADGTSVVWGVVYDVADPDLCVLDGFEDGYRRETVLVYPANDGRRPIAAVAYVAPNEPQAPPTSAEYRRLLLEGAVYWNLPLDYVAMLEKLATA
ncbi:MAG TPA: gamma-glutamylcyclotransferase family protein [Candidatus Eisenbacteria bacterium]|nr:gamma-glutamylcyclotransferase family protein [Candidatus Eisenbacteria bacterium]